LFVFINIPGYTFILASLYSRCSSLPMKLVTSLFSIEEVIVRGIENAS
jgi:hypothetical protein